MNSVVVMAAMVMAVIVRVMVKRPWKLNNDYTVISVTYIKAKCLRIPTVFVLPFIYMKAKYCDSRMDRNAIQ